MAERLRLGRGDKMAEKKESRRKVLLFFWLRIAGFGILVFLALSYAAYVLTPKYDYGICSMVNFYKQPRNSIDVLSVGTSLAYAGINTNVLWSEYGIASYNLCSAEQPYWVSYYMIREALKTQKPQVILLDAKPSVYEENYSERGRTILSTYGIRGIENRIGATLACVEKTEDAIGFLLGLPQVHTNYRKLEPQDFKYPPDNGGRGSYWKGYIEADQTERHERPSLVWTNMKRNLNSREEKYVRKIFKLCQEEGIEVMLVGVPNPDYEADHMFYNALWAVAGEYGITGKNYNEPKIRFGLHYSSDFADWQHLNVKGSVTFSRKLGKDLLELYDLPDRRGDEYYRSYEECAKEWYEKYPAFESAGVEGV